MTATLSVILICLLLSAFFSGMEIAFLTSNKLRIEIDKSKKGVTQALIDLFISHSGMYITTLLVGNNVVMVIYGILCPICWSNSSNFTFIDRGRTVCRDPRFDSDHFGFC